MKCFSLFNEHSSIGLQIIVILLQKFTWNCNSLPMKIHIRIRIRIRIFHGRTIIILQTQNDIKFIRFICPSINCFIISIRNVAFDHETSNVQLEYPILNNNVWLWVYFIPFLLGLLQNKVRWEIKSQIIIDPTINDMKIIKVNSHLYIDIMCKIHIGVYFLISMAKHHNSNLLIHSKTIKSFLFGNHESD